MDIANQLFSFTLGVEPNKETLQKFAGVLNSAVLSLGEKQQELSDFANTLEGQKFISNAPPAQPQLTEPQIRYIQAAPTPQAAQARKNKILRNPVVWQITEQQMKELQWKRKQLLQAQKAELERKRKARAKRGPPPKLGPKQGSSTASSIAGNAPKQAKKPPQPAAPAKPKQQPSKPALNGAPKPPGKAPTKAQSAGAVGGKVAKK